MKLTIRIGLFVALLLSGCSDKPPELPRLSSDAVILAFGDSLTYGTGAKPEQSYPAVLEALTGREVINAGVPGEVSSQGRERLPQLLDEYEPALLILMHGGNDLLRRQAPEQTIENLRVMIRTAREQGVAVVLLGVPKPGLWLSSAEFYKTLADEFDIPIENDIVAEVEGERGLKSDTIHPNAAGYRLIAEAVFQLLQNSGAL